MLNIFNKKILFYVLLVGVLSTFFRLLLPSPIAGKAISAFATNSFVDSIGIVIHLSYSNTPYAQNWDEYNPSQNIKKLAGSLGIRHVRDSVPHPNLQANRAYSRPRLARLYKDYGIRTTAVLDRRSSSNLLDPDKIDPFILDYATSSVDLGDRNIKITEFLEAIEGPNEYDMPIHSEHGGEEDPQWVDSLKKYQSVLYQKINENNQLSSLPVIMPSLIHTKFCSTMVGSIEDSIDYGNLHVYPNYPYFIKPTGNLRWHLNHGRDCFGDKPIYVTETGYPTATDQQGISDRTIAKYLSTLLPEFFLEPQIERTYLYSLVDVSPDHPRWGLIRAERNGKIVNGQEQFTLTPKLSYFAIKSLIELLDEGCWNQVQQQWEIPTVNPKPVDLVIQDAKDTTHYLLLQKSTGDYFFLIWQQVEAFNPTNGNFEPPKDDVAISIPRRYEFKTLYQYDDEFRLIPTPLTGSVNEVEVDVSDSVTVLQFKR